MRKRKHRRPSPHIFRSDLPPLVCYADRRTWRKQNSLLGKVMDFTSAYPTPKTQTWRTKFREWVWRFWNRLTGRG